MKMKSEIMKGNLMTKEVIKALSEWVLRVTSKEYPATPEELEALPKVAELVLTYPFEVSEPHKNL